MTAVPSAISGINQPFVMTLGMFKQTLRRSSKFDPKRYTQDERMWPDLYRAYVDHIHSNTDVLKKLKLVLRNRTLYQELKNSQYPFYGGNSYRTTLTLYPELAKNTTELSYYKANEHNPSFPAMLESNTDHNYGAIGVPVANTADIKNTLETTEKVENVEYTNSVNELLLSQSVISSSLIENVATKHADSVKEKSNLSVAYEREKDGRFSSSVAVTRKRKFEDLVQSKKSKMIFNPLYKQHSSSPIPPLLQITDSTKMGNDVDPSTEIQHTTDTRNKKSHTKTQKMDNDPNKRKEATKDTSGKKDARQKDVKNKAGITPVPVLDLNSAKKKKTEITSTQHNFTDSITTKTASVSTVNQNSGMQKMKGMHDGPKLNSVVRRSNETKTEITNIKKLKPENPMTSQKKKRDTRKSNKSSDNSSSSRSTKTAFDYSAANTEVSCAWITVLNKDGTFAQTPKFPFNSNNKLF